MEYIYNINYNELFNDLHPILRPLLVEIATTFKDCNLLIYNSLQFMKFRINFLLRPSKALKSGLINLECCITVNGKRMYQRLPRQINLSDWNQEKQQVKGKSQEAKEANTFIESYKQSLYILHSKIIQQNLPYNLETFKSALNGKLDKYQTLLQLYEEHNGELKILRDKKQIAPATHQKHTTTVLHLKGYLKEKYQRNDINLSEVNKTFIEGFNNYLRINLNIQHNTTINYLKNLKKIILRAYNDNLIQSNPFHNYKLGLKKVDIDFLTLKEIEKIYKKEFKTERLNNVKDIFIFSCFCGLSYIDCKTFDYKKHLVTDEKGNQFIIKNRNKTDILATIPLLPVAKEILEKYRYKLPVPSNQKVNEYLKEIISICGINKDIHFHCARHSFGTSITLNNNVPITSVSKMMGHTNTKITQRYAKVLNTTLINDRDKIVEKIKF